MMDSTIADQIICQIMMILIKPLRVPVTKDLKEVGTNLRIFNKLLERK